MSAPLDHDWETVSRHRSSDGTVHYQRCRCGTHRIRLEPVPTSGFSLHHGGNRDLLETVATPFREPSARS